MPGRLGAGVVRDIRTGLDPDQAAGALQQLLEAGYLEHRAGHLPNDPDEWTTTTLRGSALAMASFAKPITRARADALLPGVLERAAAYDADDNKPFEIARLRLFGSYLDTTVDRLGDIDLALETIDRSPATRDPPGSP